MNLNTVDGDDMSRRLQAADAFLGKHEGDIVELGEADHAVLRQVMEAR